MSLDIIFANNLQIAQKYGWRRAYFRPHFIARLLVLLKFLETYCFFTTSKGSGDFNATGQKIYNSEMFRYENIEFDFKTFKWREIQICLS